MSLYVKIRTWFQPYYKPRPKNAVKTKELKVAPKVEVSVNGDPHIKISVKNVNASLANPMRYAKFMKGDSIWCYHDEKVFQVLGYFAADRNAGWKYQERDDAARKQLEPIILITDNRKKDRTHLIPIGYHGSENDNRLLVMWDSYQNQNEMADFEKLAKSYNKKHGIYWFTEIKRAKGGLLWSYQIFNADTKVLWKRLDLQLPCKYVWR